MQTLADIASLRWLITQWRNDGQRIGFVPTMGHLHRGHTALVEAARRHASRVVASIFVNPLQFGPDEDFATYPRSLADDSQRLIQAGCDALFTPDETQIYPRGRDQTARVEVPALGQRLCGASRPGHFAGVTTVVLKLFNIVTPDVAVFGEKDFQQLVIIRRMVEDLNLPVEVVAVPTVREADGLAMSSRNSYLGELERRRASRLYAALQQARERIHAGETDFAEIAAGIRRGLEAAGFRPDYAEVIRSHDLAPAAPGDEALRVVAAGWLGKARLIDNIAV